MTNTMMLESIIDDRGIKKGKLAEKMGISSSSLRRRIDNDVQFRAEEINTLCRLLNITDANTMETIFFS